MHWFWICMTIGLIVLDLSWGRLFFSFASLSALLVSLAAKIGGTDFKILWQLLLFVLLSAAFLALGLLIKNKILKALKNKSLTKKE